MIQRLHELQTEEAKSHCRATKTPPNLPRDSQVEANQTSSVSTDRQDKTEGGDVGEEEERKESEGESSRQVSKVTSKPLSLLGSALKKGGRSSSSGGSSSIRLLPDFVYQASPDPASRETEDRQAGGRGGGKRQAVKENGRKAKQKLNFTSSCRTEEEEEEEEQEEERNNASDQPAISTSWSEVSSMVIGSEYRLSPLSAAMEQRLILQYLTPLGDYQEVRLPPKPQVTSYIRLHTTPSGDTKGIIQPFHPQHLET